MPTKKTTSLWKNSNFLNFWIGQSISMFGSQVTVVALPLTAVLVLHANAMEMGMYQAMATAPFLIFGLFAGAWIDRTRRRPLMIVSNLVTAALLSLIPLLAWMDLLSINILYLILFLAASGSLIFELAYLSFLPTVIHRDEMTDGNSKLEGSRAMAQIVGPSAAGGLISLLAAPVAILVDAVSYVVSSIFLMRIKVEEPVPTATPKGNVWAQIGEGLKAIGTHPILRSIAASTALLNFFRTAFSSVYMIFIVLNLGLTPTEVGIVLGVGSIGAFLGAFVAQRWATLFGIGHSVIGSAVLVTLGAVVVTLAPQSLWVSMPLLILGQALTGIGNTVYFINQVSLRQTLTPNHLLGRINASNRFISRGAMPLGGLMGGVLGTWFGLKAALVVTIFGYLLSVIWLLLSPVRRMKTVEDAQQYKAIA